MKFNFKFLCCSFVIPLSLLLTSCAKNNLKENLDPYAHEQKLIVEPRLFDVFKFKKTRNKGISVYVKSVSDFSEPLVDPKYAKINPKAEVYSFGFIRNIRYIYDFQTPPPPKFNNFQVLGRLDNYTITVPSDVNFRELFANYVKKALDEAGFNVVSSPSKYSIIVEFYPGNLIALYFDNDKSKIKVRNELFMSLSQNEKYYSYNIDCRYSGADSPDSEHKFWADIEHGNLDNNWFTFDAPKLNPKMSSVEKLELLNSYVNEILQVPLSFNQAKLVEDLKYLNKQLSNKSGKMIDVSRTLKKFYSMYGYGINVKPICYIKSSFGYVTDPKEAASIRRAREYNRKYIKNFDVKNDAGRTVNKCTYDSYKEELKCKGQ